MAAVEIICPHCNGKQKVTESRLAETVICLHCNQVITDAYLYKVQPPPPELAIAMKGKLVTDFGTTQLEDLESKADAYTGRNEDRRRPESSDFQALGETTARLSATLQYRAPQRRTTSGKRVYAIFGVLIAVGVIGIGYVASETFLKGGPSQTQVLGGTPERIQHYPAGQIQSRVGIARLEGGGEVPHGTYNEYFATGEKKVVGTYDMGRRVGIWREWHDNGRPAAEISYNDDRLDGPYKRWFTGGRPAVDGAYVDGRRDGEWREWHSNGNMARSERYELGDPVGIWTTWHANATRHVYGVHDSMGRNGRWVTLYDNSREEQVEEYQHGMRHGMTYGHYRGGERRFVGHWNDGLEDGEWRWWHPNGENMRRGRYVRGQQDGVWMRWGPEGELVSERHYDNGTRVGTWREYDRDGNLWLERDYQGGVMTAERAFFRGEDVTRVARQHESGSGMQAEWTVIVNGSGERIMHGWYREYHENGSLRLEGTYQQGERQGAFRRFDLGGNFVEQTFWHGGTQVEQPQ